MTIYFDTNVNFVLRGKRFLSGERLKVPCFNISVHVSSTMDWNEVISEADAVVADKEEIHIRM